MSASFALPALVVAGIIEAMPSRLKRRAEKLSAEHDSWTITPNPLTVVIGDNTVSFNGTSLACTCLLSPKCAHCGAVALLADVAEEAAAGEPTTPVAAVTDTTTGSKTGTDSGDSAGGQPTRSTPPLKEITHATQLSNEVLADIVEHGLLGQDPLGYAHLVAALHQARIVPLPRLERVLTSLVSLSSRHRSGDARDVRRAAVGNAVGEALITTHLLHRNPKDLDAIGTARRAYAELTPGQDDGTFIPIYAEPVVTSSGFAGAVVTLVDSAGRFFSVGQTPPGGVADVQRVWEGPVRLGDIHTSLRNFSQHKVLISGGTASADGRIGSGKGIRAALGKPTTLTELLELSGVESVSGTVTNADLLAVTINDQRYFFAPAARICGVAGLVAKILATKKVTLFLRETTIMAVWLDGIRYLPGLDARTADVTMISASQVLGNPGGSPKHIITKWLERAAIGGRDAVIHRDIATDVSILEASSAPTAAELLRRLRTNYSPNAVTTLAVYLR